MQRFTIHVSVSTNTGVWRYEMFSMLEYGVDPRISHLQMASVVLAGKNANVEKCPDLQHDCSE